MTPAPIHTAGNRRPWEQRPSADRLGNAYHRHGPLRPLDEPRRSIWQRILGKV
jgi:hypothetical protein